MTEETTQPCFVGDKPRSRAFPLAWPFEFAGKCYTTIYLKRLTAGEVAAFQEAVAALSEGVPPQWPIYCNADGSPLPVEVLAALDDDDKFELDKAVLDFLPQRYRAVAENASARSDGGSTASP